jgi:crossover junction endodeoxyribonuclease RuvC
LRVSGYLVGYLPGLWVRCAHVRSPFLVGARCDGERLLLHEVRAAGAVVARSLDLGSDPLMDVLGVDPSLTATGLASFTAAGVRTRKVPTVADGQSLADVRRRVRHIVGTVLAFAPGACLTVIEQPYVPRGGAAAGAVIERAWLYGLLVDQLMVRGQVVAVVNTTRSAYALKGGAKKKDVTAAMRERFPGVSIPDDNVADALALCAMGARRLGTPIDGVLTHSQMNAFMRVSWPLIEGAGK